MSAYLYDEALVNKLQEVSGDSRIRVISPDIAISFLAQIDKDKVEEPAIVLSRLSISLSDTRNQFAAFKGQTVRINEDNTATKIKVVPMRMEWTLDVFSVDRFTCDNIIRELVFYFITNPTLSVKVPYDANIDQNFDILLGSDIVDNSDLVDFPNTGELFRETITLYTTNAYLFSTRRQYLTKVNPDVESNKN